MLSITRRWFLKTAPCLAATARMLSQAQVPIERGRFSADDVPLARHELLKLVNDERRSAGLSKLQLDDFACQVAGDHALDMVKGSFLSHWGSDGRKPYQRYSLAGGTDAVQENVSSADSIDSVSANGVIANLTRMHLSMLNERPPKDGHRRTILFPSHTHVGFGIALQGQNLRLDELFLARYAQLDALPRKMKPNASITLGGKLFDPRNEVTGVDIYYEPLPEPPAIEWLRVPRSYSLPAEHQSLLPRLPPTYVYSDGSGGEIERLGLGRFRVRIGLSKKKGINTLVVWARTGQNGSPFPVSSVSIRVE